ncbi:MAG: DUF2752 domain-containing protein [Thermoanaerobaculia bacterium]|nr:DUF2752 domain-containing protein [Thermoanaerobaculia bacterium]
MTGSMAEAHRSGRGLWLAVGAAAAALWALLARAPELAAGDVVVCLFRRATGVPCPGCGLTRAFVAMAGGELGAAVALHPLAPLLAAQLGLAWLAWGVRLHRGPGALPLGPRTVAWLVLANAVALLAVWGIRLATGTLPA